MATTITSTKANNVLLNDVLDITKDIVISGEFSCFGSDISGGEGFCIYFINAFSANNVGSPGPGLGFAPTDGIVEYLGNDIFLGTTDSILGVGFDITGNYSQNLGPTYDGDTALHPNAITLRYGSTQDFSYISSSDNLSSYGINIYQVYGDQAPSQTSTPTPTSTVTPTKTFTNTLNTTATPTPTVTKTSTVTSTSSKTQTPTKTATQTNAVSITVTKTITPTITNSLTKTPTQTPTVTGLFPYKKAFKVRLTNYGKKIIVYIRNNNSTTFTKVYEKDNLSLTLPTGNQCQVGLSYSTGVGLSKFYLYSFSVNGIGYSNPYTPTPSVSTTPIITGTPSITSVITMPVIPAVTPTITKTVTKTITYTPTQTRSQTPYATVTYTPTNTRTSTQTSTQTRSQTPQVTTSQTPTLTPTITHTQSTPFIAAANASYKFVFESKWVDADSAAAAVNVLINNARFGLTRNQGSTNLLNIRTSTTGEGVVNDFDRKYFRAYFFNQAAEFGQQIGGSGADGSQSWLSIPFVERVTSSNDPLTDYRQGISSNIYQALRILVNTGNTLDGTLLYIDKTDNSNDRPNPSDNAGLNYPIWGTDGLSVDYKSPIFDSSVSNRYVINFNKDGRILYNFDYVDGITSRNNFITTPDAYRLIPNTRYLRVISGEIDISFSYCTELISYIDKGTGSISYWGARLTLFTSARQ